MNPFNALSQQSMEKSAGPWWNKNKSWGQNVDGLIAGGQKNVQGVADAGQKAYDGISDVGFKTQNVIEGVKAPVNAAMQAPGRALSAAGQAYGQGGSAGDMLDAGLNAGADHLRRGAEVGGEALANSYAADAAGAVSGAVGGIEDAARNLGEKVTYLDQGLSEPIAGRLGAIPAAFGAAGQAAGSGGSLGNILDAGISGAQGSIRRGDSRSQDALAMFHGQKPNLGQGSTNSAATPAGSGNTQATAATPASTGKAQATAAAPKPAGNAGASNYGQAQNPNIFGQANQSAGASNSQAQATTATATSSPKNQTPKPAGNAGASNYGQAQNPNIFGQATAAAPAAAAKPAAAAAASSGPSEAFLKKTMGSYDPNSKLDQRKAERIKTLWNQNGGNLTANQVYGDSQYGQIKSAFWLLGAIDSEDGMQKEAATRAIGKGLGWLSSKFMRGAGKMRQGRWHNAFEDAAGMGRDAAKKKLSSGDYSAARELAEEAAGKFGDSRLSRAGGTLGQWSKSLGSMDPNKAKWIDRAALGGGALGIGAGGYSIGHGRGHSQGLETGVGQGYDIGSQLGMQMAMNNRPQDPGFFGRLADVFTGQEQGPDPYMMQSAMVDNRDQIVNAILSQGRS